MEISVEVRDLIRTGRVFDLGMTLSVATPHHPNHTPFLYRLTKSHGDMVHENGASASNDMFAMGTHVGTHIDGLGHIAHHGCMFGNYRAEDVSGVLTGVPPLGIDKDPPVACRGVLLDICGALGVESLEAAHEITVSEIKICLERQGTELRRGDCVLIRTGWERHADDHATYLGLRRGAPGPGPEAARFLADRGMTLAGSDTLAYEKQPAPGFPVHVELLVERGIRIIECLALAELAGSGQHEFLFVATPLKIAGGTGSPVRPIAIA